MNKKDIGIAVIGSGRIGTLRASMAARHPSVRFLAVSDKDKTRADVLAQKTGATFVTDNNLEAISHADVDAVIVSTPEHDHVEAVLQAVELGKPVFLEKPLALTLEEGDKISAAVKAAGVELVIGYSRRHDRRWMMTKEQISQGRLGEIISIQSRVLNTRAQMLEIIKRSPGASPVLDVLTYYVDLVCWYLDGIRPVEVVARSHGKVFRELGYETDEATWALITFETGAIANIGIFYALPATYPTFGQSPRFEIFGEDGVILLDVDNRDSILYTDKGVPHAYVPDHDPKMLFMQTNSSGDWAVDDYWGPIANETRTWLDHLITGAPSAHTTIEEGRRTLEITLAIEQSARTGETVKLAFS
jgi:predicted dehydrogenase